MKNSDRYQDMDFRKLMIDRSVIGKKEFTEGEILKELYWSRRLPARHKHSTGSCREVMFFHSVFLQK
jgi:hypothetical protein